jgi:Uma2 family endonuclease
LILSWAWSAVKALAKWSISDYHRMVECGLLCDRRVELLRGDIVEISPESPIHYATAKHGSKYLETLLAGRADVRFNGPITLADSEPEPDIAVVRLPESAYFERHPLAADIYWIVEVAKSSLKTDRDIKADIYAIAGIPEYWLLDLVGQCLTVFRTPQAGRYTEEQSLQMGAIAPLAFPNIKISIERLLIQAQI